MVCSQKARRCAAGQDGFDPFVPFNASRQAVDQIAQGVLAKFDLKNAWPADIAANRNQFCTAGTCDTQLPEPVRAL